MDCMSSIFTPLVLSIVGPVNECLSVDVIIELRTTRTKGKSAQDNSAHYNIGP